MVRNIDNQFPSIKSSSQSVETDDLFELNRSLLIGQGTNSIYNNVKVNEQNELLVSAGDRDLHGVLSTNNITNVLSNNYLYGITNHSQLHSSFTNLGGTLTANNNKNRLLLSIDNQVLSFAVSRSRNFINYVEGFTCQATLCGKFGTNQAGTFQFLGASNRSVEMYFAYSTSNNFGIQFSTNGLTEVRYLDITTAATGAETATLTLNGNTFNVNLTNAGGAKNFTAYEIAKNKTFGTGLNQQTCFSIGSRIYFVDFSTGPLNGTYSFSSATATGTFTRQTTGQALSTTFINQADWNGPSSMKTDLDPNKFNLYRIQYNWYGTGRISFQILNPTSGNFEEVHNLTFSNQQEDLNLTFPNVALGGGIASFGSTTPTTMELSGMSGSILGGYEKNVSPSVSVDNLKTLVAGVDTNLLVLRNRYTINGIVNFSSIRLERISITNDGNKRCKIKIILNPTTIGNGTTSDYPIYNELQTENLTLLDINSKTYTGGREIFTTTISKNSGIFINLFDLNLFLGQNDVMVITASSSQASEVSVSVNLRENI